MVSGLYGNLPLPPFSCPGVNCTYPEVTTIGMCSSCEDVTERTGVYCQFAKDDPSYTGIEISHCNYTLPGGANLLASSWKTSTAFGMSYPYLETSPDYIHLQPDPDQLFYNRTGEGDLYTLDFVRFDSFEGRSGDQVLHDGIEWMETMTAHECVFSLCAWSFKNWSHLDGALQEGSVTQSRLRPPEALVEKATHPQGRPSTYETSDPGFPGNHTFEVGWNDRETMGFVFDMMWNGPRTYRAAMHFKDSLYLAGPDIPRTLDAMARAVTYNMMDGPNSTVSQGQVYKTETFIRVRWEWLILSIITVVSSVALLAVTIAKTCTMHQRAWKSSLAPLLYPDLTRVQSSGGNLGEGDKLQGKAAISTSLLAVSPEGAGTVSSR